MMNLDEVGVEVDDGDYLYDQMIDQELDQMQKQLDHHTCPHCNSIKLNCQHCNYRWNPKDSEHVPMRCPRCRNNWFKPFKYDASDKWRPLTTNPKFHRFDIVKKSY